MTKKLKMVVAPLDLAADANTTTTNDPIVSTTPLAVGGNNMCYELMFEILSRLPPKSLMRFKCVSKSWLYLIEKDKYLLSSQSSKSQQKILITSSLERRQGHNFFTVDLFQPKSRYVRRYSRQRREKGYVLVSAYGLFCYVNYHDFSVRIYNNCIREKTPWIKSNIGKDPKLSYSKYPICGFGFDPITQKHKVLFMWGRSLMERYKYRDFEEVPVCEVLTVGENTWRTIENGTPKKIVRGNPIYANGSLYWLEEPFCPNFLEPKIIDSILAFDVGKEKLRVIPYSNDIIKSRLPGACCIENLLEVDGHLALIEQCCHRENEKWSKTEMKLWIFIEDGKENRWIEEPIELPDHMRNNKHAYVCKSITGTNKLIITTTPEPLSDSEDEDDKDKFFNLYIYDRIEKKLNEYGSLKNPRNILQKKFFMDPYLCEASIIVDSIYPVQTRNKR